MSFPIGLGYLPAGPIHRGSRVPIETMVEVQEITIVDAVRAYSIDVALQLQGLAPVGLGHAGTLARVDQHDLALVVKARTPTPRVPPRTRSAGRGRPR